MIKIRKLYKKTNSIYLRDGVVLAFFLPKTFDKYAESALGVFNIFQKLASNKMTWAQVGNDATEAKSISKKTFDECRKLIEQARGKKSADVYFALQSEKSITDAPEYAFELISSRQDKKAPLELDQIQMTFPSKVLAKSRIENFVTILDEMASMLPFSSGYCSPA